MKIEAIIMTGLWVLFLMVIYVSFLWYVSHSVRKEIESERDELLREKEELIKNIEVNE
jgi:hypothetical protein